VLTQIVTMESPSLEAISRYRIVEKLGGGMGVVYKAKNQFAKCFHHRRWMLSVEEPVDDA